MPILVLASQNPAKLTEARRSFASYGFTVLGPTEANIRDFDVDETGATLGENAVLKVEACAAMIARQNLLRGSRVVILGDDTGLEIDGLGGEPGIHVRRWKDKKTRMSDDEIIAYALERMEGLEGPDRAAQFHAVIAVATLEPVRTVVPKIQIFEGVLRGSILKIPTEGRTEGAPFSSLFFIDEYNMALGDMHRLPDQQKAAHTSHRERAIQNMLPYLKQEFARH